MSYVVSVHKLQRFSVWIVDAIPYKFERKLQKYFMWMVDVPSDSLLMKVAMVLCMNSGRYSGHSIERKLQR